LNKTGVVNRRLNKGGVVILMFHKIGNKDDPLALTITPFIFDRILTELNKRSDIVALESLFDQDKNLVVDDQVKFAITFDDGYRDNYEKAFPILKKHNVPATIYLSYGHLEGDYYFWYEKLILGLQCTDHQFIDLEDLGSEKFKLENLKDVNNTVNKLNLWLKTFTDKDRLEKLKVILSRLEVDNTEENVSAMLSWKMIKEMKENNINFGSHTISHPILSREDEQSIEYELVESKRLLEEKTGQEIEGFAYPNGTADDYNDTVLKYVNKAAYQHACTTIEGINYKGQDPYQLLRINVEPGICVDDKGHFLPDVFWTKVAALF
jgi:peptidoglycan/xylan/chitin deacetylase (PgdA/CDA1 family)